MNTDDSKAPFPKGESEGEAEQGDFCEGITRKPLRTFKGSCEVASTGDASDFVHALDIAARAKGMSEVARKAGVTRASLYKSLSEDGNPRFETISKIVKAFGCKLAVI